MWMGMFAEQPAKHCKDTAWVSLNLKVRLYGKWEVPDGNRESWDQSEPHARGTAERVGRQQGSGQAPAGKPCSELGTFFAERHGQGGEDSRKSSTRGTERRGSERKQQTCLARSAEQTGMGRQGGEINPQEGFYVLIRGRLQDMDRKEECTFLPKNKLMNRTISLWCAAVAGGLFVRHFSRKEEENERRGELPRSVVPCRLRTRFWERGRWFHHLPHSSQTKQSPKIHLIRISLSRPFEEDRIISRSFYGFLLWKWLIFSLADISSRFRAAHETICVSKLAAWAGNLFYT